MLFSPKTINFTPGVSAQGGSGVTGNFWPWYASPYLDITPANYITLAQGLGLSPGDYWWLNGTQQGAEGNAFMFVKCNSAIAGAGLLLAVDTPATGTFTAAGSTVSKIVTTVTAGAANNSEVDNWLFAASTGATSLNLRRVKANTGGANSTFTISLPDYLRPNLPNDQDVFATQPTNGDQIRLVRPYNTQICTASLVPFGVSLGAVTSGDYTIIQVAGLCGLQSSGAITFVNQQAMPAAAGQIQLLAGANLNLNFNGASMILPQYFGTATAGNQLIPAYVNFIGQ